MALPKPIHAIFQYIDENQSKFLDRLNTALHIASVPTKQNTDQIHEMIKWTETLLKSFGVRTELKNVEDDRYTGSLPLPPVLFGNLETSTCPNKVTVLIYGNLDVCPAEKEDGWQSDPFELFLENEYIFGRGVLDKSCLVSWLNTLEAYKDAGIDYPVNVKFILQSMETKNSPGLKNLLVSEKDNFLASVDYVCITKGSWLQPDIPCIINSLRGICCISIEIECAPKNLIANICGGMIHEAMIDLIFLLSSLTDANGNLNVSLMNLETAPMSDEEADIYATANLNLDTFLEKVGANCLSHNGDQLEIMKNRFIQPTLIIHGIETSCIKTKESEIPGIVVAKLSIRTINQQDPESVFELVKKYLEEIWSNRGSKNKLNISSGNFIQAWKTDVDHIHQKSGSHALNLVYGRNPYFIPNGYCIPVVRMIEEITERNVMVFPIGSGEHFDVNENLTLENFNNAAKVFAVYLYEMAELPRIRAEEGSASFISCKSLPEVCTCGRFEINIEASGDSQKCICPKQKQLEKSCVCSTKTIENLADEKVVAVQTINEMKIEPKGANNCICHLDAPQPEITEIFSRRSNFSTATKDPTSLLPPVETLKKNIAPSAETLKCTCIPLKYRRDLYPEKHSLTPEEQQELMKSMVSFGSERSGKSACVSIENTKNIRMKILGCACPERSMDTLIELDRQVEKMSCPVTVEGTEETCYKGGRRKHHVRGPPIIDEEDSEMTLGPLSHCSCSSEALESAIPKCDCGTAAGVETGIFFKNLEDEID